MCDIVRTLPANTEGRDFVVSDIHGMFEMLDEALDMVNFEPERDRVISVGDLIDRGPQSDRCLEFLDKPWFHAIRGNHEDLFLKMSNDEGVLDQDSLRFNFVNGMGWLADCNQDTLKRMRTAFAALPIALEIPTAQGLIGFVHAEVPDTLDWNSFKEKLITGDQDTIAKAVWGRQRVLSKDVSGVDGIDRVYIGHTPLETGPLRLGNCVYIDTGAFLKLSKPGDWRLTFGDIASLEGAPPAAEALPDIPKITARLHIHF